MAYGSIDAENFREAASVKKPRISTVAVAALLGSALALVLLFFASYPTAPTISPSTGVLNTVTRDDSLYGNSTAAPATVATPANDRDSSLYARKLAQALAAPVVPQTKVEVGLYYEMGCPFCQEFLTQDLGDVWLAEGVPAIVDLMLVPYGNSKETESNGTTTFKCQHGPEECEADMIQACAINMYPTSTVVSFVRCMASDVKYLQTAEKCAAQNNMDYSAIQSCVNTNGTRYSHEMGLLTHSLFPKMQGTPWVTINGFPLEAGDNVLGIICKMAIGMGPVPAGCSAQPARGNRCWRSAAMVEEDTKTITLE